jgi:hypothetical protein
MADLDLFTPRTMTEALLQEKRPGAFLINTFFPVRPTHQTEAVDIHIVDGKRKLAPFVNPNSEGVLVEKNSRTAETFVPPLIKPKDRTSAEDILASVNPGNAVYVEGGQTVEERAALMLMDDMRRLDDMIVRREEWMASRALFTGAISIKGQGVDETIDFAFKTTHKPTLSGTSLWTDAASKPFDDLRTWKTLIAKDAGVTATDVVLGSSAAAAFFANDQIQKLFDLRQITVGQLNPTMENLPQGVTYLGRVTALGLDLWTYDEWFVDDQTGNEAEMVPTDRILVVSRQANFKLHYGAIPEIPPVVGSRWVKSWMQEDPAGRFLMVQARPLPVPHQKDAIVSAKVV